MFRTGAAAAEHDAPHLEALLDPGMVTDVNTTVSARLLGEHEIFYTDYRFFAIAVAVEVICICLVLPTLALIASAAHQLRNDADESHSYWGWWTFGRSVSFSPLEMAKVHRRRPGVKAFVVDGLIGL